MKAIVFGDYSTPPYHPLKDADTLLSEILAADFDLTFTEDRNMLLPGTLNNFGLCISYFDAWEKKLTPEQLGELISFVSRGKSLLVIHNGISYQSHPEYAQMVGAKFVSHPDYQKLSYKIKHGIHPIVDGIEDFEMEEELYTFDFDNFSNLTVMMECTNGEITFPAAWVKQFGAGRIVYLAPGHNVKSFQNPTYRKLIQRSAHWAIGRL